MARHEENCQICGRPAVALALIEGARVPVCARDSQYGQVLNPPAQPSSASRPSASRVPKALSVEVDLADDYARLIRTARQSRNLSLDQLSHAVGIRVNELHAFEEGRVRPNADEAARLERFLKLTLVSTDERAQKPVNPFAGPLASSRASKGGGTLADLVEIKPLKKKD